MAIEILSPNYILPDNDVWLLKGVPLENNYENTIIWQVGTNIDGTPITNETTEQAKERQFDYFTESIGLDTRYHHIHLSAMTYLREGRKYLRVDLPYTSAIQYNYIIFKNNGAYTVGQSTTAYHYEHRYYYAFITSFEYLNDKTTIIHYEIDLLQTYNFDYAIEQCFVEREHSATDIPGNNLVPEKLDVGERISISTIKCPVFAQSNNRIVITASFSYWYNDNQMVLTDYDTGRMKHGIYSGLAYNVFNPYDTDANSHRGLTALNNFITLATSSGKSDGIVGITTIPEFFLRDIDSYTTDYSPKIYEWDFPVNSFMTDRWTYSYNGKQGPRNKKLYTKPYTSLIMYNGSGEIAEYAYENWDTFTTLEDNTVRRMYVIGAISPSPEFTCIPYLYKGIAINYTDKLDLSNYPQSPYIIDSYRAWLAQQKGRIISTIGSGALSLGASVATGNPIALAYSSANYLTSVTAMLSEGYQHSILAPQVKGSITPYLSLADGELGYKAHSYRPKDEYCAMIDDYFDLYGYATHEIKIPNRTVRPYWCYTKTIGCRLTPINRGIPADVDDAIRKIYDNGIRFWKNPEYIGNYSLNNQV